MAGSLTVRDILQRPYFQGSTVYASEKALDRIVEWVHILEVAHVGKLLNGNEFILSTGLIWKDHEEMSVSFLQQIIDCHASGLCIELGRVVNRIPDAMKQLAIDSDFPLILIHNSIRYIDITRDIHSWIIHQQRKKVAELETLSVQFNELLLSGNGLQPLLRLYYQATSNPIAYLPLEGKPLFIPPLSSSRQQSVLSQLSMWKERQSHPVASQSIVVLNHTLGELVSWSEEPIDSYDLLALDRCATAVAQELMRTLYWEERRQYKQNQWVHEWLNGQYEEQEIKQYVLSLKPVYNPGKHTVIVFELERNVLLSPDFEMLCIQRNMVARTIFEQEGFFLIPSTLNQNMIYILLDQQNRPEINPAVTRALSRITQADKQNISIFSSLIGVGRPFYKLSSLKESFSSALETISIQKEIGLLPQPFFTELHMYRVISSIKKSGELPALIDDYLGPIIRLDQEKKEVLLSTLKTYLMLNGTKRETAKELYISRQTLYSRLDKISELLGSDFMSPHKRFTIELALYAYEYMRLMEQS